VIKPNLAGMLVIIIYAKKVANKLTEQGYRIFAEKSFPDPGNPGHYLRPDLIAIKERKALILDIFVVYQISGALFSNAYQWKQQKYNPIAPFVQIEYDCEQVQTHGMIIGARGSYFHRQLHLWYMLGFNSAELRYLAIGCLEHSLKVLTAFSLNLLHLQLP